jgi:hypothetical protein
VFSDRVTKISLVVFVFTFTLPRIGKISSISLSPKSDSSALRVSRSPGVCGPCWKI